MSRLYNYAHRPDEMVAHLRREPCPCCGATDIRKLGDDNGFSVEKCATRGCGMVYVNPRPTPDGMLEFYRTYYPEKPDVEIAWQNEMGPIFEDACDWIMDGRAAPGRILDIGCAFGHFLQMAHQRGWKTEGIEPSPAAVIAAREIAEGPIQQCGIETAALEPESFDAAVSFYVLEHVPDPRGMLTRICEALKPNGQAIIRVPYTEPFFPVVKMLGRPMMYAPMHLNDFSPRVMTRIGLDVGFSKVKVEVGRPRRSSDFLERSAARVLSGVSQSIQTLSAGRWLLPLTGALSYRLWK